MSHKNDLQLFLNMVFNSNPKEWPYTAAKDGSSQIIIRTTTWNLRNVARIGINNENLAVLLCGYTLTGAVLEIIKMCLGYYNSEQNNLNHHFIIFLYELKSKYSNIVIDCNNRTITYKHSVSKTYYWYYSYIGTINTMPSYEHNTPANVKIIDGLLADFDERNKIGKMSKEVLQQTITTTTEKTRGDRVDDAIEQAIYDMLKVKPLDVDAVVKLRSLF